jgi:hypothetical protein
VAFVVDDLTAWLVGLLADAGRRKLTSWVLGTDQQRALRQAAEAAVERTAGQLVPAGGEQAEHLAMVVGEVFREPASDDAMAVVGPATLLEALQEGIVGKLAVLDDPVITGTGQSSAELLGVPGQVLAVTLAGYLVREITDRGSRGGPLAPLADQLNHDATHLQGQRVEGMLAQLVGQVTALAEADRGPVAPRMPMGLLPRPPRFRDVTSWNAKQLSVHPAVSGQQPATQDSFVLPDYVLRPHDALIREHLERLTAESRTGLLLLRGKSCTGKTRTAYEAVQAVLPEWRLAYPKTAEALLALLDGPPVEARSVIWLDDLHHLLREPAEEGDKAASRLRDLLQEPGPVVLIATAWSDAYEVLTATPEEGHADRHHHARMLLREAWSVEVQDTFANLDTQELERLAAGDASLRAAMQAAGPTGEVTQTLAAAPALMEHWLHAHTPYGKAVITAAVDARRFGIQASLPHDFLAAAASGYLTPAERARAKTDWFEEALRYARKSIKRVTSVLLPVAPPRGMSALSGVSDLADYIEQHGAAVRWGKVPPTDFWDAVPERISSGDDLERLALSAFSCGRFRLSRDLNLLVLQRGHAGAFEGLCFSYIETDRILTQQGREELVSVVRDAEDGGYSLWYLGSTLWEIHDEAGGGGNETLVVAGELLFDSYEAGFIDAHVILEDVCAAIGVDATGLIGDAHRKREAQRAASSPRDFARKWGHRLRNAPGADGSIPPSALLASLLAGQTVEDYVVQASVVRWWRERPEETRDLLNFCCRSNRAATAIASARSLEKQIEPAARRMAEDVLEQLADDGHGGAQMELAHWRIHQWQQGNPAPDEAPPQDILILLKKAEKNRTEARRLLGQAARRIGNTAEAERLFRSALDGGDYTVLRELAEVLHPHSPEDARQLVLFGLDADGSPSPPW